MNKENIIKILNKTPTLKYMMKYIYYAVNNIIKIKYKNNIISDERMSYEGNETFFGYYDKFPERGNYIIFYSSKYYTYKIPKHQIELIILNNATKNIIYKEKILRYNWQQGTRAMWLNDDQIIYNNYNYINNKLECKIYSIKFNKSEIINEYPVQDAFQDRYYLSINYKNMIKYQADYGYGKIKNEGCGIYYINLSNKSIINIISEDEIKKHLNIKNKNCNTNMIINHIQISPDGNKFIFIYRTFNKGIRLDYLFLYKFNTKNIELLCKGIVSHSCWIDNDNIINYNDNISYSYKIINVESKILKELDKRLNSYGDGHPTVVDNIMITDTYPNNKMLQKLILYDLKSKNIYELGEYYHSIKYWDITRCDLHPKYHNNIIYFESVNSGKRYLYKKEL